MSGKSLRLKRFGPRGDGRWVILPLDHGVSCGPIQGIRDLEPVIGLGVADRVDALVLHKGMLAYLERFSGHLPGVFMHLSASTQLGAAFHGKVLVGTVEEALRRGADGVSVHVNLGDEREPEMLRDLGAVGEACALWQVPFLVMIYVRGSHAPSPVPDAAVAHAARVAAELGADVVKIPAPRHEEAMAEIAAGVPVPVVMAGGSKTSDVRAFLGRIEAGLSAGMRGVAVGRNVFQHDTPERFLRAVVGLVHDGLTVDQALAGFSGIDDPAGRET